MKAEFDAAQNLDMLLPDNADFPKTALAKDVSDAIKHQGQYNRQPRSIHLYAARLIRSNLYYSVLYFFTVSSCRHFPS